jgi:hypothetical protein
VVDLSETARVLAVDSVNVYFNDYGVLRIPKNGGAESIVDANDFVYALAADDNGVTWIGPIGGTEPYGVFAYHVGDPSQTLLATVDNVGSGIAIDAETVFFVGGPGISRISRNGGTVSSVITANPWKLAVDESFVYWSEGVAGNSSSIHKVPKTGGEPTTIMSGTGAYLDLVVDERCVYWTDLYGNRVSRTPK